eukprot:737-Pelagomonas_calceolata.AAC.3
MIFHAFLHNPDPLLLIAGWECQDLSPAGPNTGLHGKRSSTFYSLLQLVATLRRIRPPHPFAYILGNIATAYHPKPAMAQHHQTTCQALGQPVTSDAAACGAAAHRLRHFWTNLLHHTTLQSLVDRLTPTPTSQCPPTSTAQHNLDPGRCVQIAPGTIHILTLKPISLGRLSKSYPPWSPIPSPTTSETPSQAVFSHKTTPSHNPTLTNMNASSASTWDPLPSLTPFHLGSPRAALPLQESLPRNATLSQENP